MASGVRAFEVQIMLPKEKCQAWPSTSWGKGHLTKSGRVITPWAPSCLGKSGATRKAVVCALELPTTEAEAAHLLICKNITWLGCVRKGSRGERQYSQGLMWATGSSKMEFFCFFPKMSLLTSMLKLNLFKPDPGYSLESLWG